MEMMISEVVGRGGGGTDRKYKEKKHKERRKKDV